METESKKILIIRLGAIGDVVHSTVIAQAIKAKYPRHKVHFITASYICQLLENNEYLDKVIPFEMKNKDNLFYLIKKGLELRKERYDYIINLTNATRNFIMIHFAAPKKLIKRNAKRVHAVDAFYNTACDALGDLPKPEMLNLGIDKEIQEKFQNELSECNRPIVILSSGGDNDLQRQGRIWVDDYWKELGNQIVEKYNAQILIIGSKTEENNHKQYSEIKNAKIYSGKLSLKETAALISICDLFISGDSGPLHLADAVGAKTIALMGSTHPRSSSAYSKNGKFIEPTIECKYCGQRKCKMITPPQKFTPCMISIKPKMVLDLIEKSNLL